MLHRGVQFYWSCCLKLVILLCYPDETHFGMPASDSFEQDLGPTYAGSGGKRPFKSILITCTQNELHFQIKFRTNQFHYYFPRTEIQFGPKVFFHSFDAGITARPATTNCNFSCGLLLFITCVDPIYLILLVTHQLSEFC